MQTRKNDWKPHVIHTDSKIDIYDRCKTSNRESWTGFGRKLAVSTLVATLLLSPFMPLQVAVDKAYAQTVQGPTVSLVSEDIITAGAALRKYVWTSVRGANQVKTEANVVVVDLQQPYVKLDVMTGVADKFTTKQTVRGMARETGAVAGINGDFYDTKGPGVAMGPTMSEGTLLASPNLSLTGMYAFALTKDRKPIIDTFTFEGKVIATSTMDAHPLAGINKQISSHGNAMYVFTSAWGSTTRVNDTKLVPIEVLVQNNVVVQISDGVTRLETTVPADGYILSAAGTSAKFIQDKVRVGDTLALDYWLKPTDPSKTYDTTSFETLIGGHTILVDNGAAAAFSRDVSSLGGYRSRTALGYSQDGRYVYLVTVDNSGDSKGMSLSELQKFMVNIGVWKGLNLDGGGSTQLVSRPLAETDTVVVSKLENGVARQVVNGLGVYTTAPLGKLQGLFINSELAMFINEKKSLSLKGFDEYYNPYPIDPTTVEWTVTQPETASMTGHEITALQPGTVEVKAVGPGGIAHTKKIDIVGRKDLQSMQFEMSDFVLTPGDTYELPVVVVTVKGVKRTIPAELLSWEFIGFTGEVSGNKITVTEAKNGEVARIIARYDGFSTMLTKTIGTERVYADFDKVSPQIGATVTPAEVVGTIAQQPYGNSKTNTLTMSYDFTLGTGTKAVYAAFGDGSGIPIEGSPSKMSMNVYGDGSLNWLRAEFVDANNQAHLVDIANPITFTGWKAITIDLDAQQMAYPITLKRLYIANPENGQDERAAVGTIAIDDLVFQYKSVLLDNPKPKVEMAIGRKSLTVDGQKQTLDVAPYIVNDTTLIPVRFFVDAMGGKTVWHAKERKVTIIRDSHLIEMWLDDPILIIDGKQVQALAAPSLKDNRTMLPLRVISEALGWQVGYNAKTQSITLE